MVTGVKRLGSVACVAAHSATESPHKLKRRFDDGGDVGGRIVKSRKQGSASITMKRVLREVGG